MGISDRSIQHEIRWMHTYDASSQDRDCGLTYCLSWRCFLRPKLQVQKDVSYEGNSRVKSPAYLSTLPVIVVPWWRLWLDRLLVLAPLLGGCFHCILGRLSCFGLLGGLLHNRCSQMSLCQRKSYRFSSSQASHNASISATLAYSFWGTLDGRCFDWPAPTFLAGIISQQLQRTRTLRSVRAMLAPFGALKAVIKSSLSYKSQLLHGGAT